MLYPPELQARSAALPRSGYVAEAGVYHLLDIGSGSLHLIENRRQYPDTVQMTNDETRQYG